MALKNPNKIPVNNNELAELLTAAMHACNMAGEAIEMPKGRGGEETTMYGEQWECPNKIDPAFHVSVHDTLCDALRIVNPKLLECYIANGWAVTVDYLEQERAYCDEGPYHSGQMETPTSTF